MKLSLFPTVFLVALIVVLAPATLAPTARAATPFPEPVNNEPGNPAPISPPEALAKIQLPPGFKATVFAAEPDVQNPIALTWDSRGRLWVAENYTYTDNKKRFDLSLRDRILVFEDTRGDGRGSSRKVFTDDIQMLTSIAIGHGGVWAMCPPNLFFIPDADGDDVPDGPKQIVLDGFDPMHAMYHNFANGLKWGPDGWLYGRCGGSCPGEIGVPGTPPEKRVPLRGGLWRFHPKTKTFETIAHGATNPWGHDWNADGEPFFVNTVNGHLWHAFAGARFVGRAPGSTSPFTYELIDMHADHWHFDTGRSWTESRAGKADAYGGGHAHIGAMVYRGDNWPAEYRGKLFTLNQHGRRMNCERLERDGSGYVARHEADTVVFGDPWFKGLDLDYGPDGGVFVLDWSDTGECHDFTGVHRTSGRIFKITYGDATRPAVGDLAKLSNAELIKLHTHANEWFTRLARRELARRTLTQPLPATDLATLRGIFTGSPGITHKLRALFTLHVIGADDGSFLRAQLRHADDLVRAQAVKLLTDTWPLDRANALASEPVTAAQCAPLLPELLRLAREDSSAAVRLALASTLQRLNVTQRPALASALVARAEDANDHNLPLLVWHGLIQVAAADPNALAGIARVCEWPTTRRLIARRLATDLETNSAPLNTLLAAATDAPAALQIDLLTGIAEATAGLRRVNKPAAWTAFTEKLSRDGNALLRAKIAVLGARFGDARALADARVLATDARADVSARKVALQTLIDQRAENLRDICESALTTRALNAVAVRGLARENDPALAAKIISALPTFIDNERASAVSVLASRSAWALALVEAVARGRVAPTVLTATTLRELRNHKLPALDASLKEINKGVREIDADKRKQIAEFKVRLTPAVLATADKGQGRAMFNLACAACHTLYGEGGKNGPDLTGAGRDNLDYLLENIIDPSAVVAPDYRVSEIRLKDERTLTGIITERTERTVTLKTVTEILALDRRDIASMRETLLSLMPDGLLQALPPGQVANLIAYLMAKEQVALPVGK